MEDTKPTEVILITGSARGIGKAIAERIATPDRGIVINYLQAEEEAQSVVKNIQDRGGRAFAAQADVSDRKSVEAMADQINRKWGKVSTIIHNASSQVHNSRIEDTAWKEFETHWTVQVQGAFNLVQTFISDLKDSSGQLIFILSSVVLQQPPVQRSAYTTAKYGLMGFARSIGPELIKSGVRVNMVSPYLTETEISPEIPHRAFELWAGSHPMERLAAAEDTTRYIMEFRTRVQNIFREIFEDSELSVTEQTVANDISKWDSLTHISLVIALEEEFAIEFSSEEVTSMGNVGDLFTMLESKGVGNGAD